MHFFRQTQSTTNHEHDFGGSQLDLSNEICRLISALVLAVNTINRNQVNASICAIDSTTANIASMLGYSVTIIRKMRQIDVAHRYVFFAISRIDYLNFTIAINYANLSL